MGELSSRNPARAARTRVCGVADGSFHFPLRLCTEMHVRAIFDNNGRIMVIATHNTDNGDGWEREGEEDFFFHEFSEKRAYPLGINIIFYLMTH